MLILRRITNVYYSSFNWDPKTTGQKLSSIYLFIEIIKNCVPQIEVTIKLNDKAWLRIKKGNKKTRLAVNLIVISISGKKSFK